MALLAESDPVGVLQIAPILIAVVTASRHGRA